MPVEIEQTPHQEKEWNRIGEQMLETAVYQWMCENSEHAPLFHRIYSQSCEVPIHACLQKLKMYKMNSRNRGITAANAILRISCFIFRTVIAIFVQYYGIFDENRKKTDFLFCL